MYSRSPFNLIQNHMRPVTDNQWQDAVDAAQTCMMLELAKLFDLVNENGEVDITRCAEIIADGHKLGIEPSLYSSVKPIRDVLKEMVERFDGIDNGYCTLCHTRRLADLKGNIQPCTNTECLSYRVAKALAA